MISTEIVNFSRSSKNSYVKFLFGKKLDKPISVQAHAVSASALKEFKRIGEKLILLNLKKNHQLNLMISRKKFQKKIKNLMILKKTVKKS